MDIFSIIKDEKSIANRMNILFTNWNYLIKKMIKKRYKKSLIFRLKNKVKISK